METLCPVPTEVTLPHGSRRWLMRTLPSFNGKRTVALRAGSFDSVKQEYTYGRWVFADRPADDDVGLHWRWDISETVTPGLFLVVIRDSDGQHREEGILDASIFTDFGFEAPLPVVPVGGPKK